MAMTDVKSVFLDTNILVFANVAEAPFHEIAHAANETRYNAGTELWISRQIIREYLATLTRPQTFSKPQPTSTAIERARFFQNRFRVAEDGPQVTEKLLELMEQVPIGGKQVHDANIVATMLIHGVHHLLTHNTADFARFSQFITVRSLEASL